MSEPSLIERMLYLQQLRHAYDEAMDGDSGDAEVEAAIAYIEALEAEVLRVGIAIERTYFHE